MYIPWTFSVYFSFEYTQNWAVMSFVLSKYYMCYSWAMRNDLHYKSFAVYLIRPILQRTCWIGLIINHRTFFVQYVKMKVASVKSKSSPVLKSWNSISSNPQTLKHKWYIKIPNFPYFRWVKSFNSDGCICFGCLVFSMTQYRLSIFTLSAVPFLAILCPFTFRFPIWQNIPHCCNCLSFLTCPSNIQWRPHLTFLRICWEICSASSPASISSSSEQVISTIFNGVCGRGYMAIDCHLHWYSMKFGSFARKWIFINLMTVRPSIGGFRDYMPMLIHPGKSWMHSNIASLMPLCWRWVQSPVRKYACWVQAMGVVVWRNISSRYKSFSGDDPVADDKIEFIFAWLHVKIHGLHVLQNNYHQLSPARFVDIRLQGRAWQRRSCKFLLG